MKSLRQLGIVILLLVSYLSPAMACVISGARMNAVELACCRTMKNQCEQMGMQSSHGCCKKTVPGAHDNALEIKATTYHPILVAAAWLAASYWFHPLCGTAYWPEHPGYSPPKSPPSSISVLRI